MSEISPELKRALDTIARLTTRRRADDTCVQSNPTKTREEAEAWVRKCKNELIEPEYEDVAHTRHEAMLDLLDFIYGKTEQEEPLKPPECLHDWAMLVDSRGWGCTKCGAFLPDRRI